MRDVLIGLALILIFIASWSIPLSSTALRTTRVIFGIVGTLLIISTELFYTLRKESRFKTGSIRTWLRVHIATGLIGPALILWHGDFEFPGLAGILTYLTIVIVVSGLFGRYIYRLIPRTIKGQARSADELRSEETEILSDLNELLKENPELLALTESMTKPPAAGTISTLFTSGLDYYRRRRAIRRQLTVLGAGELVIYKKLTALIDRRLQIERGLNQLRAAQSLLSGWTSFHKPLTLTLLFLIGVHLMSVIYYGRIMR